MPRNRIDAVIHAHFAKVSSEIRIGFVDAAFAEIFSAAETSADRGIPSTAGRLVIVVAMPVAGTDCVWGLNAIVPAPAREITMASAQTQRRGRFANAHAPSSARAASP